jgi:hypothetical protein
MNCKVLFLSIFVLIGCNQRKDLKNIVVAKESDSAVGKYPFLIDSFGLQSLYDKAKWTLYCIYCDDTCRIKEQYSFVPDRTFGTLDLRFSEIRQHNDTIEMDFYFYINDTTRYDISKMENFKGFASGVGYKNGSDSILFYTSQTTMRYFWKKGETSRYAKPLQPEVIDYIRSNKDKLNHWFREEAIRKGIIN